LSHLDAKIKHHASVASLRAWLHTNGHFGLVTSY
jgi:hypothetical protein